MRLSSVPGSLPFSVAALALAVVATVALAAPGFLPDALRAVLAPPLVLLVPGLALSLAIWPGPGLGGAARLLLALGLSLAVAALGGLALHLTPGGLQPRSWAVLLAATVLIAGLVGIARRRLIPPRPAPEPARPEPGSGAPNATLGGAPPGFEAPSSALRPGLLLLLAAVVVGGAWSVARGGGPAPGVTQLWMLPADEGGAAAVRLGVRSQEPEATRYTLRLEMDGQVLREWPALELRPGQQWEERALLPPPGERSGPVTAALFRAGEPGAPYRHVLVWPQREG